MEFLSGISSLVLYWISSPVRLSTPKSTGYRNNQVGWDGVGRVGGRREKKRNLMGHLEILPHLKEEPCYTSGEARWHGKSKHLGDRSGVQSLGLPLARCQASSYVLNFLEAPFLICRMSRQKSLDYLKTKPPSPGAIQYMLACI